jgi:hypothetical protein
LRAKLVKDNFEKYVRLPKKLERQTEIIISAEDLDSLKLQLRQSWEEHEVPKELQACFESCVYRLSRRKAAAFISKEMLHLHEKSATVLAAIQAVQLREASMNILREIVAHVDHSSDAELQQALPACAETLETHRMLSLNAVDTIVKWREGLVYALLINNTPESYRLAKQVAFTWKGTNYLVKMKTDNDFLKLSSLERLFNFSSKNDPFLVVPSNFQDSSAQPNFTRQEDGKVVLNIPSVVLNKVRLAELVLMAETRPEQGENMRQIKERKKSTGPSKVHSRRGTTESIKTEEGPGSSAQEACITVGKGIASYQASDGPDSSVVARPDIKEDEIQTVDILGEQAAPLILQDLIESLEPQLEFIAAEIKDEFEKAALSEMADIEILDQKADDQLVSRAVAPLILQDLIGTLDLQVAQIATETRDEFEIGAIAHRSEVDALLSTVVDSELLALIETELQEAQEQRRQTDLAAAEALHHKVEAPEALQPSEPSKPETPSRPIEAELDNPQVQFEYPPTKPKSRMETKKSSKQDELNRLYARKKKPSYKDNYENDLAEEVAIQILSGVIREFASESWVDVLAETILEDEREQKLRLLRINTVNPAVEVEQPLDYSREVFTPGLYSPNAYSVSGEIQAFSEVASSALSESEEDDEELYPMKLARRTTMTASAAPQFVQMKVKNKGLRFMLMDYYSRLPDELLETVCPFEELWRQYLEKKQNCTWFWMVVEGTIIGLAVLAPDGMNLEALHFSTLSVAPYGNALELFLSWVWTASKCTAVRINLYSKLDEYNLHVLNRSIKAPYDALGFKWRSVKSAYLPDMNITVMGYDRPHGIKPQKQEMQMMPIRFFENQDKAD